MVRSWRTTLLFTLALSWLSAVDMGRIPDKGLEPDTNDLSNHIPGNKLEERAHEEKEKNTGTGVTPQQRAQILDNPICRKDIPVRCEGNRQPTTDLETLDCILNHKREEAKELAVDCNHALWTFRKSIMQKKGFLEAVHQSCHADISKMPCFIPGQVSAEVVVICVIENKDKLESEDCRDQVSLVERVMFSDYELIERFADSCQADIARHQCGRNHVAGMDAPQLLPSSQGHTIECLSSKIEELNERCKVEILRVAELQADDYHLDRALYFSCRDDRETFCKDVNAGNGKVYRCLLQNKMEPRMSEGCRASLIRRQQAGWHDYKVTGIAFTCKSEIKKFRCRKGATESDKHVRLAQILLCLENATHLGQGLNGECVEEMRQHRKALMEDYNATPELLASCNDDRQKFCKGGKSLNGKTIHCLMQHAMSPRKEERIQDSCREHLEELLKLTDVSENWMVDPVLKETCQPVVIGSSCRDVPSQKVMTCLMHILTSDQASETDAHAMTSECESTLLQIQYFVTREFTIDYNLYETCREDARKVCGLKENWSEGERSANLPGGVVLSCLYRNLELHSDKPSLVSKKCGDQVREAMKIRAFSVRLNPELEEPCMEDLGYLCADQTKPGEELECLQKNVKSLSPTCSSAVTKFTEIEVKDPSIDPYLWKYCGNMIEKCAPKSENDKSKEKSPHKDDKESIEDDSDEEDDTMLECLIKLKPEMKNKKCRARVEHLQLLQLKNVKFSEKFKLLCNADVIRRCSDEKPTTSSKLVTCLSEVIWNDTLSEQSQRISKGCRKQVKYLTLSKIQLEDRNLDEGTFTLCKDYITQLCKDVPPGGGRIFECLRSHKEDIDQDTKCYSSLFKLQKAINQDSTLDAYLAEECKMEIKNFCPEKLLHNGIGSSHSKNLLTCLKLNIKQEGFDLQRCGKALRTRLVEQNSDVRLNPRLQLACGRDIAKFCGGVKFGDGRILQCLKKRFVLPDSPLSTSCKTHVEEVLQASAADVRLDYTLNKLCHKDIERLCKPTTTDADAAGGDGGKVEPCLMDKYRQNLITDLDCKAQVQLLIQSTQIDIHVDPALNRACALDLLQRCDGIPSGEGRLVGCLLTELEREQDSGTERLSPKCRVLLSTRSEMFKLAGKPQMDSIQELYTQVKESPQKNYFLLVAMTLVGCIFVFGLFCGRATKRKTAAKEK